MEIYTLIKTRITDMGSLSAETEVIYSTTWKEEVINRLKETVREFFYDYLYTDDNEVYMEECQKDPRMADFEQVYDFYLSSNGMWWGVNEWNTAIQFEILTINIE